MQELLNRLIAKRGTAGDELETLTAQRKAITDMVAAEAREDLNSDEDTEFRARTEDIAKKQGEIAAYDERIKELSEEMERSGKLSESAAAVRRAQARVTSVKESRAYEKGNGHSYFSDLMRAQRGMDSDGRSAERLRRHAIDVANDAEYRDLDRNDGSGGFFVPPAWMMSQYASLARAGRAYANVVTSQALPPGTDSINIPRVLTGAATAIQPGDNQGVSDVDLTDTSVNAAVRTISGQQDVAIQLLDQSPVNFDEVIFQDLIADYATKLNVQVISGTGAPHQVLGVRATPSIETVTATTAGAGGPSDVAVVYSKLADAVQRVHTLRFMPPTAIVMHPRRWAFFLAATDSIGRPLVVQAGPGQDAVATSGGVLAEQVVGQMHGLPVITDPSMPITVNTNQDVIHVLRASDLLLYESGVRSRVLPEVGSGTLTVRLQVYGYLAFTAGRYPKSVVEITGSALAAPTF